MAGEEIVLRYKPDFGRAQQYWDAFWGHEIIDRPCTVVWAKKRKEAVWTESLQAVEREFGDIFRRHDQFLESYAFLGECMPGFRPGFGPDQFAGFLGAPIVISPYDASTSWSKKIVSDWEEFLPLKVDEENPVWKRMVGMHEAASEYYAGKCLIYNIDFHSNIDLLEGLRGAEKLMFDMIDSPELILKALGQAGEIHRRLWNRLYEYGNKKQLGTTMWLQFYSRGKYDRIQADYIALLNPSMFRQFALPAIEAEADFLDHSCFHLDGPDALKHLDDILAIEALDAVQWVPGAGNREYWPEVHHAIQKAGKAVIVYGTVEQIKAIHGDYKPELLVYEVIAESEEEGVAFLEWLKNHT